MAKGKEEIPKPSSSSGGKAKKKKWSKGKVKEKINNSVICEQETYDRLFNEIPVKNKLITPSVISDKLKISVSLARQAIKDLEAKGVIKRVGDSNHTQMIYTRAAASE